MRFSFAWYTSLLGARKKINVLGFLTDENKSVLVSLVLFLPVTQTPRVRFPDMEDSLFFLFFNRRRGLSFENAPAERHFARVVKGLAC